MKIKLTKLQWIALIGFLVIALLGGGGYYYVSNQLAAASQELDDQIALRDQLLRAPIYPSEKTIEVLKANNELLRGELAALRARLITPDNRLREVQEKNPIEFKQDLGALQKKLTDLATAHHVLVSSNFTYGFGRYFSFAPSDKDTIFLGKQMIAIGELVTQLYSSDIDKMFIVRRTFDEMPGSRQAVTGSDPAGEMLRGRAIHVANGLYTVYPFELEFFAKPVALRSFLNKLIQSPYIFVVRYVQVTSSKLDPVHLDNLARAADAIASSTPAPDAPADGSTPPTPAKPPMYAVGFEDIKVDMRVDLIEWHGEPRTASRSGLEAGGSNP